MLAHVVAAAVAIPALMPRPRSVVALPCARPLRLASGLRLPHGFDDGARIEIEDRWRRMGIPLPSIAMRPDVTVVRTTSLPPQAYRLVVNATGVRIEAGDAASVFYAATTLAQLPVRTASGWVLPCARIDDQPALRWRILSDDVSRGPLPTMRYFEERIRTIAFYKMNGYSPYMENTFVAPSDPLPAPLDGITPAQLHELARYAARFHVALIPDQQTFAHMHGTLRYEAYADLAELPHGFLLSPSAPGSTAYVRRLITAELAQVPHPPFFHVGSDETLTLGEGTSAALVRREGLARVYADHVRAMVSAVAPSGARVMIWDDGVERDPAIMRMLPRSVVLVDWHYQPAQSYERFIRLIANGGFDQLIAPGANNWNEVFPNIAAAIENERTFIDEGKAAHVLGLFECVWMDDGQTLYQDTWYPVLYAADAAWERGDVPSARFAAAFPRAFFGTDDARYAADVAALGDILTRLERARYDWTDELLWADPFDPAVARRMQAVDLHRVRLEAEAVEQHLLTAPPPPLHPEAASTMFLAARTYDVLARSYQIADEVRAMYDQARRHAGERDGPTLRDLLWCRYWFREQRDDYEELARLYARAWTYESRPDHLASNVERFHMAAARAIERSDAMRYVEYEEYLRLHRFPTLDQALQLPR